eukprot:538837-Hanusia_phi.AAC.1
MAYFQASFASYPGSGYVIDVDKTYPASKDLIMELIPVDSTNKINTTLNTIQDSGYLTLLVQAIRNCHHVSDISHSGSLSILDGHNKGPARHRCLWGSGANHRVLLPCRHGRHRQRPVQIRQVVLAGRKREGNWQLKI